MIPHALHSVNGGASRVILLSNDTDVVVLGLHYWSLLKDMALRNCGLGLVLEILPGTYHFILWKRRWTQRSAKSYCHSITSLVVIYPNWHKSCWFESKPCPTSTRIRKGSSWYWLCGSWTVPCKCFQIRNILWINGSTEIVSLPSQQDHCGPSPNQSFS